MNIQGTTSLFYASTTPGARPGRLRYLVGGTGSPVVLLHTVRTQAEHFHRLIPFLLPHHTVYALDLPGMGHSDITPGASYTEPSMRHAVADFLTGLDLRDVIVIGESMGAVLALTVAADLPERTRRVIAINPYDYAGGIARSGLLARALMAGIRTPGIGPIVAGIEPRPAVRAILRGGLVDKSVLTDEYLDELLAVGRRPQYAQVAYAVFTNLPSLIAARSLYPRVKVPVRVVYGDKDWSRPSDRHANEALLPHADFVHLPNIGHFASLEGPVAIAALVV